MRLRRSKHSIWWVVGVVIALVLLGIFVTALWASYAPKPIDPSTVSPQKPQPQPVSIKANTLFLETYIGADILTTGRQKAS